MSPRTAVAALAAIVTLVSTLSACTTPDAPESPDVPVPTDAETTREVGPDDPWVPEEPLVKDASDDRPNVVLVLTDDMRRADLKYLPNIRRLLTRQGTYYDNAISPHPLCCPARAELATGQYGQNSGVRHNTGEWGGYHSLEDHDNVLGAWLEESGYLSFFEGKYLNGYHARDGDRPPGWTRWDAHIRGLYEYGNQPVTFANGDVVSGEYIADIIDGRTKSTLDAFAGEGAPFFAFINHPAPHVPIKHWPDTGKFPVPEKKYAHAYRNLALDTIGKPSFNRVARGDARFGVASNRKPPFKLTKYFLARLRSLRSVDDSVAMLVRHLTALDELDNTYIVFASDNGLHLGEHGITGKNTLYRESLDVPIVVRGPGVARNVVDHSQVTLLDLFASLMEWTGTEPGRVIDGLPLDEVAGRRDTVLIQTGDAQRDSTPGWAYRGVQTGRYTYAEIAGNPARGLLFDDRLDPAQLVNRFRDPRYRLVRQELMRRLRVLEECSGAACNQRFGPTPQPR